MHLLVESSRVRVPPEAILQTVLGQLPRGRMHQVLLALLLLLGIYEIQGKYRKTIQCQAISKCIKGSAPCDYSCSSGGGCTVKYTGPPRSGPISGSCFSASFGGSCSGTPPECQDCNVALTCSEDSEGSSLPEEGKPSQSLSSSNGDVFCCGQSDDHSFLFRKETV